MKELRLTIFAWSMFEFEGKLHKLSLSEHFENEENLNKLLEKINGWYQIFQISDEYFEIDQPYDFVEGDELQNDLSNV